MNVRLRWLIRIAFAGPIYYVVFVTFLGLLWDGYDPIRQTQSELGAVNAPHGLLMNVAGFMALGLATLAFASAYLIFLRRSAWMMLSVAALVGAGLGFIIVGFFPCDAGCVDITPAGELHSVFSMPPAVGLPLAMILSALAFRSDGRFGASWQLTAFVLGLIALGSGPIIAAEMLPAYDGLLQRAAMWTPILWTSAVALRLYMLARSPTDGSVGSAALGPPVTAR